MPLGLLIASAVAITALALLVLWLLPAHKTLSKQELQDNIKELYPTIVIETVILSDDNTAAIIRARDTGDMIFIKKFGDRITSRLIEGAMFKSGKSPHIKWQQDLVEFDFGDFTFPKFSTKITGENKAHLMALIAENRV